MKKIKILLIEDNKLLRDGIVALLKKQPDMKVVATIGNSENILDLMQKSNINIVLLDLGLRNKNSLELVKLIKANYKESCIIIMDLIPLQTDVLDFVKAGVSGFILKDANINDFYNTIRSVFAGEKILPSDLTSTLFNQIIEHAVAYKNPSKIIESVRMTKREKQVIGLIADGLTNKEIAQKIHVSTYTVKSHVHNILEKLALNTRVQVAKYAHLSKEYSKAINNTSLIDD